MYTLLFFLTFVSCWCLFNLSDIFSMYMVFLILHVRNLCWFSVCHLLWHDIWIWFMELHHMFHSIQSVGGSSGCMLIFQGHMFARILVSNSVKRLLAAIFFHSSYSAHQFMIIIMSIIKLLETMQHPGSPFHHVFLHMLHSFTVKLCQKKEDMIFQGSCSTSSR